MTNSIEGTIDKILDQTLTRLNDTLDEALQEAKDKLDSAASRLETEYDRIVSDGRKEAEKLERQIVGGADLEGRNRQLVVVEEAVDRVFKQAVSEITSMPRDDNYKTFCEYLVRQAAGALNSADVVVYTNENDRDVVQSILGSMSGPVLSKDVISCMGGVRVSSQDGTVSFDNTIDARIERLKPLIRKTIAAKFGVAQ